MTGPPPRSSRGRGELGGGVGLEEIEIGSGVGKRVLGVKTARPCTYLGFPGTARQPGLGAAEAAAALSGPRKAFGTRAADWERAVLRCFGHSLPQSPPHSKSEYFQGRAKGARCGETDHTLSSLGTTEIFSHCGPPSGFAQVPPAEATCPVGLFLAPAGLPLQSPRPGRGRCPPRGLVSRAPAPRPRPTAGGSRATCRVQGEGRSGPRAARRAPPGSHSGAASLSGPRCPARPACGPPRRASRRRRPARFRATWRTVPPGSRERPLAARTAEPHERVKTARGNWGARTWRLPRPRHAALSFADTHTHTPEGQPRGLPASVYCT